MFNKEQYLKAIKSRRTRYSAMESLEQAIKGAEPREAFELHKLRTPGTITLMELKTLNKAGFPKDKLTPDGEPEILVKAWKAGAEHAKKYWPLEVAHYYYMDNYQLSEDD